MKKRLSPFFVLVSNSFIASAPCNANAQLTLVPYTVTTNADTGVGSLREAITEANATSVNDEIVFDSSLFANGACTITLQSALPTIASTTSAGTLTITGQGATSLIISGNTGNSARNFRIFSIASGGNLAISGATVSGAKTTSNGAAFSNLGSLTIANFLISGNAAGNTGGGVYSQGYFRVSGSTFTGNSAHYGGGYYGGQYASENATVFNCTFSGNTANDQGGALFNNGVLTITNTTISGNTAPVSQAGGLHSNGTIYIANTIIANNTYVDTSFPSTTNLISPATASSNLVTQSGLAWATTVTSAPLNLGSLQNNGGTTSTLALGISSVAIGAANATISNAAPINGLDQRGISRSPTAPSIGAYEVVATTIVAGVKGVPAIFTFTEDTPGNLIFTGAPFAANLNTYFGTAGNVTNQGALNNDSSRTLSTTVSDLNLFASTTTTINFTAVNDQPTLATIGTLTGATEDVPHAITHAALAAANELDADGVTPTARSQSCVGDLNGDHTVNVYDLGTLLGQWGQVGTGDIDGDGVVFGSDLGMMLGAWGPCAVTVPSWATLLEAMPDPAVVTDSTLREAITASGIAWRVRDNGTNIEMLLVPLGSFTMGCSASTQYGCEPDESPTHQVTLTQAFYMGRYEVTQAQWMAQMGSNPSWFVPANGFSSDTTKPVEHVTWNMIASAGGFLSETGLRLPTEAEWEYAYRAGSTTALHSYPTQTNGFDDDTLFDNIAWYSGNNGAWGSSTYGTKPVGGKFANALGLYDMSGNVWEWCQDWYSSTYYASNSVTNPTGPTTGTSRALRGGSWFDYSHACRSSQRDSNVPVGFNITYGFRVARDLYSYTR